MAPRVNPRLPCSKADATEPQPRAWWGGCTRSGGAAARPLRAGPAGLAKRKGCITARSTQS
eukprot:8142175-Alexandrium_andersonii.AAC.1